MRNSLIIGGLLVGILTAAAYPQATPTDEPAATPETYTISDEEFKVRISDELADEVDELIAQLGSPQYGVREAATTRLTEIGLPAFAQLLGAYRATDELEPRLRIERIVQDAYLTHYVYSRNAFLGISHQLASVVHSEDPRIPQGHLGIKVVKVLRNTGAEEAGVEENDVIIALDGEPLPVKTGRPTAEFGESITLRGPGTAVTLTILRGPDELEIAAVLRSRPKEYYTVPGTMVTQMLRITEQQFEVWWDAHFRTPPSAESGTNTP